MRAGTHCLAPAANWIRCHMEKAAQLALNTQIWQTAITTGQPASDLFPPLLPFSFLAHFLLGSKSQNSSAANSARVSPASARAASGREELQRACSCPAGLYKLTGEQDAPAQNDHTLSPRLTLCQSLDQPNMKSPECKGKGQRPSYGRFLLKRACLAKCRTLTRSRTEGFKERKKGNDQYWPPPQLSWDLRCVCLQSTSACPMCNQE